MNCESCGKETDILEQEHAAPGTEGSKRRSVCSDCNKKALKDLQTEEK